MWVPSDLSPRPLGNAGPALAHNYQATHVAACPAQQGRCSSEPRTLREARQRVAGAHATHVAASYSCGYSAVTPLELPGNPAGGRDSRGCISILTLGNKLARYEYRAADEYACVAHTDPDREVVGQPTGMVAFRFGRSLAASSFELRGQSLSLLAMRDRAHEAVRILFLRSPPGVH